MSLLPHCQQVAVQHGKELHRIDFLPVILHFDMQQVSADAYHASGPYPCAEGGKCVGKVGVGHFILTVAYHLVQPVRGVAADTRHHTVRYGGKDIAVGSEVHTMVEKLLLCH